MHPLWRRGEGAKNSETHKGSKQQDGIQNIPTTFKEMFQFNAAVMGFGQNLWMNEILLVRAQNLGRNLPDAGYS